MSNRIRTVYGPAAGLGSHVQLDIAIAKELGDDAVTVASGERASRKAPPGPLRDALKKIAGNPTRRSPVRELAAALIEQVEAAMREDLPPTRITWTIERVVKD